MTSNLPRHRERTEREFIDEPRSHGPLIMLAVVLFLAGGFLFLEFLSQALSPEATWPQVCLWTSLGCTVLATGITIKITGAAARLNRR
ncbi:MAG: hypothetical protein HOV66_02440 [Streptomycetaceae bacterium]|nr:hypothetical protein [Streptomycetaceae bacterium]NUS53709.1 hypothetical protein [Streptomycetaceae bacterium]